MVQLIIYPENSRAVQLKNPKPPNSVLYCDMTLVSTENSRCLPVRSMKKIQWRSRRMVHFHRIFIFLLLFRAVPACKSTCEKAVDKTIACAPSAGLKSELHQARDLAIDVCSPHEDAVKNCIKLNDCVAFHQCMKKAVVFREAPPRKIPDAPPESPDMTPEDPENGANPEKESP